MKTKFVLLLLSIAFSLNQNTHAIAMTGHHHAPVAKTTVEVEGLNVAFGIHSSTGMAAGHEAMAEGSVREGEFADVVFHVTEEKTGEPVSSLELASWISLTNDNSVYIYRIVNTLRNNAITGMILIALVLFIFLGKSNAFLAS